MSPYLPADAPFPDPDPWEAGFWAHCAERRLMFQSCADCGVARHPPMPVCPHCRSERERWVAAPDDAEIYTFTIVRHASHPSLVSSLPYNAAVVAFPSLGWLRLVTNIVDAPPEALAIGLPVTLCWEEPAPGRVLPRFRLAPRS